MAKKLTEQEKQARAEKKLEEKKTAEKKAEEARLESNRQQELVKLQKSPLPLPKYPVKVGEVVLPRTARWNQMTVLEVLDEGKILLCEIDYVEHNYGKNTPAKKTQYVSCLEVIPQTLKLNEESFTPKDRWTISFHNRDLSGLLNYHYGYRIDYSPVYQRELVWKLEDKQSLIHSIFTGVEIGKFVLIPLEFDPEKPGHEILDGKQRLNALIDFYEDKFTYRGKCFSELSVTDKRHFLHYNVTVGETREDITLKEKMDYFLKLNTTGVPQSLDHLAKVEEMLKKEKQK